MPWSWPPTAWRRSRPRQRRPDLVLMDASMPRLDGFEVCRRLKADPSLPFIPIILVTAKDRSSDIVAGLEAAPTTT